MMPILSKRYKALWPASSAIADRPVYVPTVFMYKTVFTMLSVEKLAVAVANLKVGDGRVETSTQGPLIDEAAIEKVQSHIADAISKGAQVKTGGQRSSLGGTFFEPTLLTEVTQEMKVAKEETFGPLAPLFRFKTGEEAVQMANDTEFGLANLPIYSKHSTSVACW